MTLEQRVIKVAKLLHEKEKLLSKKKQLKEIELYLDEDWDEEIKHIEKEASKQKEIEKQLDEINNQLEEEASFFLELLYKLKLEKITFNLEQEAVVVRNKIPVFAIVEYQREEGQV